MQSFAIGSNLDLTACLVSNIGKVTTDSQDNANNLSIEAGSIQAELGGRVDIQEKIKVTSGLSTITAEEASYDETAGVLQIPKSVVFENPDLIIFGESAKLLTKEKTTIHNNLNHLLCLAKFSFSSSVLIETSSSTLLLTGSFFSLVMSIKLSCLVREFYIFKLICAQNFLYGII